MNDAPSQRSRRAVIAASVLLAGSVYVLWRCWLLSWQRYDLDEFINVHLAWGRAQGWRFLIEDFDLTRSPWIRVLLLPFVYAFGEGNLVPYRCAVLGLSVATLGLFALCLRRFGFSGRAVGVGVALPAVSAPFLLAGQQIRVEPFTAFFAVAGAWFLLQAATDRAPSRNAFFAAVVLGFAAMLTAVFLPVAVAALIWLLWRGAGPSRAATVCGFALPVAVTVILLSPRVWLLFGSPRDTVAAFSALASWVGGPIGRHQLLLPLLAAGTLFAWATDSWRETRAWAVPMILVAVVFAEGAAASWLTVRESPVARDEITRRLAELDTAFVSGAVSDRPGAAFTALYKLYDPFFELRTATRQEQDAMIAYFNRHVGPDDRAMATYPVHVFRGGSPAWTLVPANALVEGFAHARAAFAEFPELWRDLIAGSAGGSLFSPEVADLEAALMADLTTWQPKVVLIDRSLLDLWFGHPKYLDLFDRNYELRFDPLSRHFFAHRTAQPWTLVPSISGD